MIQEYWTTCITLLFGSWVAKQQCRPRMSTSSLWMDTRHFAAMVSCSCLHSHIPIAFCCPLGHSLDRYVAYETWVALYDGDDGDGDDDDDFCQ